MHLIKEKYDIDEILNNKINNILKFLNIKSKIEKDISYKANEGVEI